jgi:hypothetical protein
MAFNDYAKGMYIIVEFSKKWEGIPKYQRVGSVNLTRCHRCQDGDLWAGTCINIYKEMSARLLARVGKVPFRVLVKSLATIPRSDHNLSRHYSRTMVEKDVWQTYADTVLHLFPGFLVLPYFLPNCLLWNTFTPL